MENNRIFRKSLSRLLQRKADKMIQSSSFGIGNNILIYTITFIVFFILVQSVISKTYAQQREGVLTDIDGNIYNSVFIGEQEWMRENLRTTRYKDGVPIPNLPAANEWTAVNAPAYAWYNNDISHKDSYGALYNWFAVASGNLCPSGWRMPTDTDWEELTDFLGGQSIAGGKLKESGTSNWNSPNSDATNSSGFSALPGGYRWSRGNYVELGINGYWWSGTECTDTHSWSRTLYTGNSKIYRSFFIKNKGFSVRCIKDN